MPYLKFNSHLIFITISDLLWLEIPELKKPWYKRAINLERLHPKVIQTIDLSHCVLSDTALETCYNVLYKQLYKTSKSQQHHQNYLLMTLGVHVPTLKIDYHELIYMFFIPIIASTISSYAVDVSVVRNMLSIYGYNYKTISHNNSLLCCVVKRQIKKILNISANQFVGLRNEIPAYEEKIKNQQILEHAYVSIRQNINCCLILDNVHPNNSMDSNVRFVIKSIRTFLYRYTKLCGRFQIIFGIIYVLKHTIAEYHTNYDDFGLFVIRHAINYLE